MAQTLKTRLRRDNKAKGARVRKTNVLKDKKSGKLIKTPHTKETIIKLAKFAQNSERNLTKKRKRG